MDDDNALLRELKTRARLRLNAARRGEGAGDESREPKLRDCLNAVSRDAGFAHWEHARTVLGGDAATGADIGAFWYAPGCAALLNQWFADYDAASAVHARERGAFLLPYRRQFVVVKAEFIRELGLDPGDASWEAVGRDLARAYASPAWVALASQRLRAMR